MNIPLSTHLSSCERHSKTIDCTVTDDFFLFNLETALPQARSFQPVACPINTAPSPTKFNTACPPPDPSALSFKSITASLQLLRLGGNLCHGRGKEGDRLPLWVWAWAFHGYDFSLSWILIFLGVTVDKSMASVCLGKTTCQKWMARLHARGVRACVHALSPSQQRLIPSRSHRNDGSLWAVEFSDHVQILPWASPSQYSQK